MNIAFALLLLLLKSSQCYLTDYASETPAPSSLLSKRISGGYTVKAGTAPYAASLAVTRPDGSVQNCGATIISSEYLITAAHCLEAPNVPYNSSVKVAVGYNSETESQQISATVTNVYINPQNMINNVANADYDIAIIQVAAMSGSDTSRIPIYTGQITANQNIIATGWGVTATVNEKSSTTTLATLQAAKLYVGAASDCKKFDSDFGTNDGPLVCTLSKLSNGAGVCSGDAGTPAYTVNSAGNAMLVGIASRIITTDGNFCGSTNSATMFVHIAYHIDYIMSVTGLSSGYLDGSTDLSADATASGVHLIGPDATTSQHEHSSTKTVSVSETFVKYYAPL